MGQNNKRSKHCYKTIQHSIKKVLNAKNLELKSQKSFHVYDVVPDDGHLQVTTAWVINEKLSVVKVLSKPN